MSLQRSTLISEIASQMIRTDLNTRIAIWLNWGLTRIDRFADLKGLNKHAKCVCVEGQVEYAFPTDCKYIKVFKQLDHLGISVLNTAVTFATNLLTVTKDISTGTRIIFLNSNPPGPLVTGTTYYAINVSSTTIRLASTSALATAETALVLTEDSDEDATHILHVHTGSSSRVLGYLPEKEFMQFTPDPTETSSNLSEAYVDRDDMFELNRPPDDTYILDLRYVKWQDEMDADADIPEVSKIDDIIVAATVVEGWHALGELALRDKAEAYFMRLLGSHKAVDSLRPDYSPKGKAFGSSGYRGANLSAEAYKYPFISGHRY